MTDIHSHIIPFVDDGSGSMEKSLDMLREEVKQGVDKIICTPHLRKGLFETPGNVITENFGLLKKSAEENGIKVRLFLGRELFYKHSDYQKMLDDKNVPTINGGKHVLIEFDTVKDTDIDEVCYVTHIAGYIPVIAHIERYEYFRSVEAVEQLKRYGTLISVNADTIVSHIFGAEHRFASKLLKRKLVDMVGSDVHSNRENCMRKAYLKVAKTDKTYADEIFGLNAEKLLNT